MSQKKSQDQPGPLFIPGGLMIGMGIGFLTENLVAWLFIGLGVGFLLFALSLLLTKNNND